ncbi:unnamed protein product [Rhizoctonia solani]|uniref:Laminin domain protein n=1 Tax=Rhizoctonia solani TaxID=456999 RepID=A0A8H3C4G0_9AGAM|nr:unnamed protein product [Rhizoctonia solani]
MSYYPAGQVCTPPDLPQYLRNVYDLKTIVGVPSNEEIIQIHAVIRVANQVINIPGIHDAVLHARLSQHLFDAQMAKYRSIYPCSIFPSNITYTPPLLPAHLSVRLQPVTITPSNEQIIGVQDAIRIYQKCAEIPSMFDPQLHADLSQHLFDIQMAKYIQRCSLSPTNNLPPSSAVGSNKFIHETESLEEGNNIATNNAGIGGEVAEHNGRTQADQDSGTRNAMERANQLAEQANQLAERSNWLVEQSNQLLRQFGNPMEKLDDALRKMSKVLVGIQHAIVRNHKGNTINALDCLINEDGETPGASCTMDETTISWISACYTGELDCHLPVVIDGTTRNLYIDNLRLGEFLYFYGIGKGLCESETSIKLKAG